MTHNVACTVTCSMFNKSFHFAKVSNFRGLVNLLSHGFKIGAINLKQNYQIHEKTQIKMFACMDYSLSLRFFLVVKKARHK